MTTPLAFTPPRLYVLRGVWADPLSAARVQRMAEAWPSAEVRTFDYADVPDLVVAEGWDHFPKMGTLAEVPPPIPVFTLYQFDRQAVRDEAKRMRAAYKGSGHVDFERLAGGGAFTFFTSSQKALKPCATHVCRPQWRLNQGRGCPHQCAYCALGGYLISHVNTEAYVEHLAELVRRNPWQKTWLYDDVMDVPTMEPQLNTLPLLMKFFESTGDRYLLIHTKTDRVDGFLAANAPRNTIGVWSLSGHTQSRLLEPKTGATEGRIEAARVCEDAGMLIRYKFKPIVPVRGWREEAAEMIALALRRTRPDNLSMTVLMWMKVDALTACIRPDRLDPEFLEAALAAKDRMGDERVAPFPPELREVVYRHYLAEIRARDAEIPVTISTESLEMWERLGPALGFTPSNYVCGCGAGATPHCRKLESNPWLDARAAVDWNGAPAVTQRDGAWEAVEPA
jgi:spore photoproduct lyase